jgi:hypothetical protein
MNYAFTTHRPTEFTMLFPDILYFISGNSVVHFVGLSVENWLSTMHGRNNIKLILRRFKQIIREPYIYIRVYGSIFVHTVI